MTLNYLYRMCPELVMSTDLLSFEHPSVLLFCMNILPEFTRVIGQMNRFASRECYDKHHNSFRILSVLSQHYKQLFKIKYKQSNSLGGNTYANENLNQANISNKYEKFHFSLIIVPVFTSTNLPETA